jgi:hypothetical protein
LKPSQYIGGHVNELVRSLVLPSALAVAITAAILPLRSAEGSALSDAAAALSPGQWIEFSTGGIANALLDDATGGVGHIMPYADKLHWDPVTNRIYYIGSDDPGDGRRFVAYDEASNAWVVLPDPWSSSSVNHQYGLVEIDVAGRRIYSIMPAGDNGLIFNLTTSTFGNLSFPSLPSAPYLAAAYFPERGALIYPHGQNLRQRTDAGQWSVLSTSINTTYHAIAHYNPVHKLVVFGGGNDSNRTFYRLSQGGQVTTLRQPPIALESPRVEFVVNPSDGSFLVFGRGPTLHSYDPVADVWSSRQASSVPTDVWAGGVTGYNILPVVATTIARYGIGFFVSCYDGGDCAVHLYKFAPAPPIPNAPTALTAN